MMKRRKNFFRRVSLFIIAMLIVVSWNSNNVLAASGKAVTAEIATVEKDPYENVKKICLSDIFNQQQRDYYVYFYMTNCSFCNQVRDEMLNFSAVNNNVYFVDYALIENRPTQKYNWTEVQSKYNKKIGYIDNDGNIIYLSGESEEKYQNMQNAFGKTMRFDFITISSNNISLFPEASVGDIFTDVQTPEIDYYSMTNYEDMIVAGVPSLFRIYDGKIVEFYFDSPEIATFLDVSIQ